MRIIPPRPAENGGREARAAKLRSLVLAAQVAKSANKRSVPVWVATT